jgi:hypothetical protein
MFEDDDINETMWKTSLEVSKLIMDTGLSTMQGKVVLARTLAVAFRAEGIGRHEAITRFTEVVKLVYDELDKSTRSN